MTTNTENTPATELAAAAQLALDSLTAAADRAKSSGLKSLRASFGPDADNTALTLAIRTARVMAGGPKPRGGAADRINKLHALTLAAVTPTDDATPVVLDAKLLVTGARVVLDAHKDAEAKRREAAKLTRQAAKDKLNDRSAPVAERRDAFNKLVELDGAKDADATARLTARIVATFEAARDAKLSPMAILSTLADVFPGWAFEGTDPATVVALEFNAGAFQTVPPADVDAEAVAAA